MHFNGHGIFGRDKPWDFEVFLGLQEFCYLYIISMSLSYVVIHKGVVLNNVLRPLFLENVISVGQIKVHKYKWVHW